MFLHDADNVHGVDADVHHTFDAYQSEQTGDNNSTNNLWPVLSFLIVVIVFAAVAFVLVIHHYRYCTSLVYSLI